MSNPKTDWNFERKGFQERNINNLVSLLNNKQATETLTAIAKIDKETWGNINTTVINLKDITNVELFSAFAEDLKESISLRFEEVLAPLKNEWNDLINTLLEPLMPYLEKLVDLLLPIVEWIADRIAEILEFLTGGGGHSTFEESKPFIENYMKTHPGATYIDALIAYMESLKTPISTTEYDWLGRHLIE